MGLPGRRYPGAAKGDAGYAVTVIADVAVLVGSDTLVAVMTADPAATPVTRPDELTVAVDGAELLQVTS